MMIMNPMDSPTARSLVDASEHRLTPHELSLLDRRGRRRRLMRRSAYNSPEREGLYFCCYER